MKSLQNEKQSDNYAQNQYKSKKKKKLKDRIVVPFKTCFIPLS